MALLGDLEVSFLHVRTLLRVEGVGDGSEHKYVQLDSFLPLLLLLFVLGLKISSSLCTTNKENNQLIYRVMSWSVPRFDYISAQSKAEYQYLVFGRGKLDRSGRAYCDLLIRDLHIGTRPIGRVPICKSRISKSQ